jgi:hypothetical protein
VPSPQQVSNHWKWNSLDGRQAPDPGHVRATCNASLRRDVSGFVESVKESKPPDLPSVKHLSSLQTTRHVDALKFSRYHKHQKTSAIPVILPAHPI